MSVASLQNNTVAIMRPTMAVDENGNMAATAGASTTVPASIQVLSSKDANTKYGRHSGDVVCRFYLAFNTDVRIEDSLTPGAGLYSGQTFKVIGVENDPAGRDTYTAIDGLLVV